MNLIISRKLKLCHISIVKENMGQGDKRDFLLDMTPHYLYEVWNKRIEFTVMGQNSFIK
jgi:hypothetical protein